MQRYHSKEVAASAENVNCDPELGECPLCRIFMPAYLLEDHGCEGSEVVHKTPTRKQPPELLQHDLKPPALKQPPERLVQLELTPHTPPPDVQSTTNPYLPPGHPAKHARISYGPGDAKPAAAAKPPPEVHDLADLPPLCLPCAEDDSSDDLVELLCNDDASYASIDSEEVPIEVNYRAKAAVAKAAAKQSVKPTAERVTSKPTQKRQYAIAVAHLSAQAATLPGQAPAANLFPAAEFRQAPAANLFPAAEFPPRSIIHNGCKMVLHYENKDGTVILRCAHYRKGCKARCSLDTRSNVTEKYSDHLDSCYVSNGVDPVNPNNAARIPDVTEEMKQFVDCQALMHLTKLPSNIAKECLAEMKLRHGDKYVGLSKKQLTTRVYDTRRRSGGGLEKNKIDTQHMHSGHSSFCRAQQTSIDPKTGDRQEVLLFSKKPLLDRMKAKKSQVFFDATFSSVPKGFYQCLIVMIFDEVHDIYLPCYYALMSSKNESCYRMVFNLLSEDCGGKFDPATIGVDFEPAFINALKQVFPNARIIGCLFHWKQAIRRKMIDMGIPKEVTGFFMKPGKLDLLTVLPLDDVSSIDSKGVLYVARELESAHGAWPIKLEGGAKQSVHDWITSPEGKEKMTMFWTYMERQWFLKKGMIKLWNLSEFISSDGNGFKLVGRTNCALERYNRSFNGDFARRHPGLATFTEGLDRETDNQVTRLEDIAAGRDTPPTYNDIPFPTIPADYDDFEVPSLEHFGLTGKKVKGGAGEVKKAAKKSSKADSAPTGVSPVKKSARTAASSATVAPVRKSKRVPQKSKTFDV